MGLTKAEILARSLQREKVHVKAWDGDVWMRRMSGAEREACIEASDVAKAGGKKDGAAFQYKMLATVLCDEKGTPLFTEDEIKTQLDGVVIDALLTEAMRIGGLGQSEQVEKNLGAAPSGGSGSSSLAN